MFNTKNLIILCISGILAASFTHLSPLSEFPSLLVSSFSAVIIMLLLQSIKIKSDSPAKPSASTSAKKSSQAPSDPNRELGTVKWFDSSKGYGFITRAMGEDIFVHFRSIKGSGYRSLYEGQAVEFLVTEGSKGPQAEDIKIVS